MGKLNLVAELRELDRGLEAQRQSPYALPVTSSAWRELQLPIREAANLIERQAAEIKQLRETLSAKENTLVEQDFTIDRHAVEIAQLKQAFEDNDEAIAAFKHGMEEQAGIVKRQSALLRKCEGMLATARNLLTNENGMCKMDGIDTLLSELRAAAAPEKVAVDG